MKLKYTINGFNHSVDASDNQIFKIGDDVVLSNEENVKNILKNCSIDNIIFFEEIKNQRIKDKLKKLTNDAFEKDIFGAPTFVVNNKIFWGQDRLGYALDEYNS